MFAIKLTTKRQTNKKKIPYTFGTQKCLLASPYESLPLPPIRTIPHQKHTYATQTYDIFDKIKTLNAIEYNAPTPQYTSPCPSANLCSPPFSFSHFLVHPFHTYFIYLNYLKYLYCYNKCTKRTLDKQTEFLFFIFRHLFLEQKLEQHQQQHQQQQRQNTTKNKKFL